MPTFDFSAPFVAARIIDQDGNSFPFWTNLGGSETDRPTLPGGEELQAMAFLQEVQVSFGLGFVPKMTAQLSPPFREGMAFLNSRLANAAGRNALQVQFGYSSGTSSGGAVMSPVFTGQILQPDITIDTDVQISLITEGVGPSSAARQNGIAVAEEGEVRADLIRRIAENSGRRLRVDFADAKQDEVSRNLLNQVVTYTQGNKTDWLALWELITSARCWMSYVGDTLHVLSRGERWRRAPVRRYRLFDLPGGRIAGATMSALVGQLSEAEMPILSFSTSSPGVWLPQNQFGVRLADVGEHTREVNERILTPAELANPVGGTGSETIEGDEQNPAIPEPMPGDPDNESARSTAIEDMARGANIGIQCEIESLGDPSILPGVLVRLAGLGRRFDNVVYRVHLVSHSVGTGGFSTNLTLISNIDPSTNTEDGGEAPTGNENTNEVEERDEGYVTGEVFDPWSRGGH